MPSDDLIVHVIDDDEAMRHSLAFLFRTARIGLKPMNPPRRF